MTEDKGLKAILSNPLLLLVVGGILTGLLIPSITKQWQNHQKELEIKIDLISDISESLAALLVAREYMEIDYPNASITTADAFRNQYREWSTSQEIIGSKLSAYFPKSQIRQEWEAFTNLTNAFYAIVDLPPPNATQCFKCRWIYTIKDNLVLLDAGSGDIHAEHLFRHDHNYMYTKEKMIQYIKNQKDRMAQNIMSSSIPL